MVSLQDALDYVDSLGLDLVEVNPDSSPPVCRVMDYGKHIFEERKKQSKAKKNQKQIQTKEIKFRPNTDVGDFNIKIRACLRFLEEGHKLKITIRYRGREMAHQEIGRALFERVRDALKEHAKLSSEPNMEGRQLTALLTPIPGVKKPKPADAPLDDRD